MNRSSPQFNYKSVAYRSEPISQSTD